MALDAGKVAAFPDVFPELGVLAAFAPGQGVFPGRAVQHHFAGGQHYQLLKLGQGPLAGRVKAPDGLHFVPPELQAHRLLIEGREQVDDAAAHTELALLLHHRTAGITSVQQALEKFRSAQGLAGEHVGQ